MKRHRALERLSRDHHHALVVAQRLKRADAATGDQARRSFLDYWERDGAEHFREEEEILLPGVAAFSQLDEPIYARVLLDHVRIRRLAGAAAEQPDLENLRVLGHELEQHVRREERELFPLIERAVPEDELNRLAARLGSPGAA